MAKKKVNRKRSWMPTLILVFALISIALILVDVSVNLSEAGVFVDQGDSASETVDPIPTEPVETGPTPTAEPVGPA